MIPARLPDWEMLAAMRGNADLQDVTLDLSGLDWSGTPIGPVSDWDVRLRTVVGLVLRRSSPACLFWGASGTIIFNKAWRKELEPLQAEALGQTLNAVWENLLPVYSSAVSSGSEPSGAAFAKGLMPMLWRFFIDRPGEFLSCVTVMDDQGSVQGLLVQSESAPVSGSETASNEKSRNAFLLRLSDSLRRLEKTDEIQVAGTRSVGEFLDADRASFTEVDLTRSRAWQTCEYRSNGVEPLEFVVHNLDNFGPALRMLQKGVPLVFDDLVDPQGQPTNGTAEEILKYSKSSCRAQLTVPILRADMLVAVFTIRHVQPHEWNVEDVAIVHEAAVRIWEAVERSRAEEQLRQSEARHRALFESIDEGVCLFERLPIRADGLRDYRYISMNPAMQAMFGIPDLTGQSIRDNFPDEIEDWYDDYDRVLDTGEPIRMVRESEPQGMVLEMFVTRVEGVGGRMLLAVMQNVTDRVRAEEALRTNERQLRNVLDGMDEAFGLMDNEFRIITHNRAALEMDGRPIEEIVGRTHWEVYPGTEDSEIGRLYKRALAEHVPVSLEHRYEWPDGHGVTWLDMRAFPVPEGLAVFWRDITQRKKAEEALRSSELRLRLAQKAAGIVTFDFEVGSRTVTWSPEAIGMLGIRPGDLGGSYEDWIGTIHPDDLPHATEQIEWALEDGELEGEWRVRRADGSFIYVLVRGTMERDAQNRPARLYGAQVDVTDRVRSEQDTRALISDLGAQIAALRRRLDKGEE